MSFMTRLAVLVLSVGLYGASLAAEETFCVSGDCVGWPGMGVLLMGGLGVAASPANATWLANPLIYLAWVMVLAAQPRAGLLAAVGALGLGILFLFCDGVMVSERGSLSTITGYARGYWLWLASQAAACAGAAAAMVLGRGAAGKAITPSA